MKIVRLVAVPLGIPLKKPLLMAGRRFDYAETVLVRVETTGKFIGHGEAPVAPFLTGETTQSVLASIDILAQTIVGRDARDLISLSLALHGAIVGNAAAKAAVEVALHDAVAREYGVPVYRLLGGRTQTEFGCLTLIGNNDQERDLADVMARAASGFSAFKLKVANGDLEEEASTLTEMRKRLGQKALVCADANGGWTAEEAIRFVRLAQASSADFLEQPVPAGNSDGMIRVARSSSIPICADESIHEVADIRRLLESRSRVGWRFQDHEARGDPPVQRSHTALPRTWRARQSFGKVRRDECRECGDACARDVGWRN